MNQMHWVLRPLPDSKQAKELANQLGTSQAFPFTLANILLQRGIGNLDDAKAFFKPQTGELHDPFNMKDMELAVDRLVQARISNEKILLFGDYDVDGTTAISLFSLFFTDWGFNYDYYVPDRYTEGYGVSYKGIDYAVEIGASLIISLDCGIKAHEKVRYARQKNLDFIICDHHTPEHTLPEATAILDPKRPDCSYPYNSLTGCGVAFKLIQALSKRLPEEGISLPYDAYDPLSAYADLLALSIACDIVPLTGENRTMAWFGLEKLRQNPLPGIKVLMDQAQEIRSWDISDLVFFLGPRINSAGRLNHASQAVEVLVGKNNDLFNLAGDLQDSNEARKDLDKRMTEEAMIMIAQDRAYPDKASTVLYNPDWHKGIIGIVASRLIETHYRPTVLLTHSEGKLVGSARSVVGFDLYGALVQCEDHLLQFGGHKYAAGLSMKSDTFEAFCKKFDEVVSKTLTDEQKSPVLYIDHSIGFSEINARFMRLLNRMAPFGPQNPRPVFMSENVLVRHAKFMKDVHIRLVLEQDGTMLEAIGFNLAEKWNQLNSSHITIAFQPYFNTWNGKTRINLRIKDIKLPHESF